MNRPWPVTAILVVTIAVVAVGVLGLIYSLRLANEGIMDPESFARNTSLVHLTLTPLGFGVCFLAAVFLFRLQKLAITLFAVVFILQILEILYFWIKVNDVNIDAFMFIVIIFFLYSLRLYRRGFLA